MSIKSIKLSKYFSIIKPQYIFLKITPDKSIRNSRTDNIAKAISYMYKTISKRIRVEQKKLFFETNFKVSYIIDITKESTNFYFMVPEVYKSILVEKITEVWPKATVSEVDHIERLNTRNTVSYQLSYKYRDALSLDVNRASNEPLNSLLNVIDIMKDNDRVVLCYNFIPHKFYNWNSDYKQTMEMVKDNRSIIKDKTSTEYILKTGLNILSSILNAVVQVIGEFLGNKAEDISFFDSIAATLEKHKESSNVTKKKKECILLDTQIAVLSSSEDSVRAFNNASTVCSAFNSISEDNELVYRKTKDVKLLDTDIRTDHNTFSSEECSNFIQLPGRDLMDRLNIKYIDTLESDVPAELLKGCMCIGTCTYKGKIQNVYLSTDKDYKNLTLVIIGPTRAGKTTLISNISKDSIDAGETTILFDFCGECDLSREVSKHIQSDRILNIDCSDASRLQGLGYNEIKPINNTDFEVYRCAKTKTSQLISLINAANINSNLEPRMERYLKSAALVVFVQNGSINDVFKVLTDYKIRKSFIDSIPANQNENVEEYVQSLGELDDWSKATKDNPAEVIGTKISFIQGILNRLDKLKSNAYLELMLKKDCRNNIDLAAEMQKSKLICIKMPETMFSTDEEKDIYCTYWLTKIWGALQIRYFNIKESDRIKTNIVFDELYQVPACQNFLKSKLNQLAKKQCKPIISCHSLEQISYIRPELKSANTSYMLISGCNKDNYQELKEELEPYELDDLLHLKRYHSLNLIKYENGYAKFITKLPYK